MPHPLSPLWIVIPAYNAQSVVTHTLDDVFAWIDSSGVTAHVVVVDDGSSDRTGEAVWRYPRPVALLAGEANAGKGAAVRRGVLSVLEADKPASDQRECTNRHGWVLFMDVDNSTPIRHLDRFAPYIERADVLIGSRRTGGSRIVKRQHPIRQMLGKTFPYVVRAVALPQYSDTQCGFKLFRASAAQHIFPAQRIRRFAFDVELLMLAERLGLRVIEVPVDWENPTASTLRVARDAPKMLLDVLATVWRLRRRGRTVRSLRRMTVVPGRAAC